MTRSRRPLTLFEKLLKFFRLDKQYRALQNHIYFNILHVWDPKKYPVHTIKGQYVEGLTFKIDENSATNWFGEKIERAPAIPEPRWQEEYFERFRKEEYKFTSDLFDEVMDRWWIVNIGLDPDKYEWDGNNRIVLKEKK